MKSTILALLLSCIGITTSFAATNITAPAVSGHWTTAGSPYYIHNQISVSMGQSLIIDPGVQVLFKGQYDFVVWGSLQAIGTAAAPIIFDVADTTGWHIDIIGTYDGAWAGLYFCQYTPATDISTLSYCNFKHLKYTGVIVDRSMQIDHCVFTDNKGQCLTVKGNKAGTHEVSNCDFYSNSSTTAQALFNVLSTKTAWYVHDNNFHDNSGYLVRCDTSTLLFSGNSVYNNTGTTQMLGFFGRDATPCYVAMNGNKIYNNQSAMGAVIYCQFAMADIYNNYLCNNYHLQSANCAPVDGGGALYLMGNGDYNNAGLRNGSGIPSLYTVRNNVIANNYSALYGSGVGIYNAKTLIANNTIVNNKAPRGAGIDIYSFSIVTVCMRNNILYGNINESGALGNVSLRNGGKANIRYDHNWTAYNFSTDITIQPWTYGVPVVILGDTTTNVIGIDPGIASPTLTSDYTESAWTANFDLVASSGCINKGNNAAVPAPNGQLDYAGNDRIVGNSVDIGAYEYSASAGTAGPSVQPDSIFNNCCAVIPPIEVSVPGVRSQPAATFAIYPNPASSIVFIATPQQSGAIHIADVTGKQIMMKQVAGSITLFDVHTWARGIYYATWTGDSKVTKKIIVE